MAKAAVARLAVLGSRNAAMPAMSATQTLTTPGQRASRPAKVRACIIAFRIYMPSSIKDRFIACYLHDFLPSSPAGSMRRITTKASTICSVCGTLKDGKRSCCAPGGAWFMNCGDAGDSNFDHTWAEGINACKSTCVHNVIVN